MNSKRKGSRLEREAAAVLRSIGLDARRTQQYQGLGSDGDLVVPGVPIYWESKGRRSIGVYPWMEEATASARGRLPVVLCRGDRKAWLCVVEVRLLPRLVEVLSGRVHQATASARGNEVAETSSW